MSIFLWSYSALIFSHQIAISDMCKLQFIIGYSRTNAVDLAAFAVCPWLFYYRLIRFPLNCGDAALASRLPVQKACTLVAPRDTTNCFALASRFPRASLPRVDHHRTQKCGTPRQARGNGGVGWVSRYTNGSCRGWSLLFA